MSNTRLFAGPSTSSATAWRTPALEKARRLAPSDQNVAFTSVLVFELAGKRERALAALKEALGAGYSLEEARREPELAELRKDPRCRRLLGWGS